MTLARLVHFLGALVLAVAVFVLGLVIPAVVAGPSVQTLTGAAAGTGASGTSGSSGSSGAFGSSGALGSSGSSGAGGVPGFNGSKQIFVVGDSLTAGAQPWLAADLAQRGWTLDGVDARVGREVTEGMSILRAQAADLPQTVMVALGTNDLGATRTDVDGWLRTARQIVGSRRLIWVNLCLADHGDQRLASYRVINAALRDLAPGYHVELADWCAYAKQHGLVPGSDGVHYQAPAYRQRAYFYALAVARPGRADARRSASPSV